MARTQIATDDFSAYTNDTALTSPNWAQLNSSWGNVTKRSGPIVTGPAGRALSNAPAARWIGSGTFTNDQYASIAISTLNYLGADYYMGVVVRASADTDGNRDFYAALVYSDAAGPNYTVEFGKFVNGSYTSLHSASVAFATTDRIELEVEGTQLRVCKNGTPLGGSFTQTDAALTTGQPGIIAGGTTGEVGGSNWLAGNLTGGVEQALAGSATGSGQAAGVASVTKPLGGEAVGGAGTQPSNLSVSSGTVFRATLVDYETGQQIANWTGLTWWWAPTLAQMLNGAAIQGGTGASTDGNGLLQVAASGGLSPALDQGFFVVTDYGTAPAETARWAAGQFDIISL